MTKKTKSRIFGTILVVLWILLFLYAKGLQATVAQQSRIHNEDWTILADSLIEVRQNANEAIKHTIASLDQQDEILAEHQKHIKKLEAEMAEVIEYLNTKL